MSGPYPTDPGCPRCVDDETLFGVRFEPCEAGCGTDVAWLTPEHLRDAGWIDADEYRAGFLERGRHRNTTGRGHRQQWERHTPERCRELRGEQTGERA